MSSGLNEKNYSIASICPIKSLGFVVLMLRVLLLLIIVVLFGFGMEILSLVSRKDDSLS